jgi:hypothetical protein
MEVLSLSWCHFFRVSCGFVLMYTSAVFFINISTLATKNNT